MNSEHVQDKFRRDSGCWKPWRASAGCRGPDSYGVYAFRVAGASPIERVEGASDIIYVGHGNIQKRLTAHARPDWKKWNDSGWLICLISHARELEVAWVELPDKEAVSLEKALLESYLVAHRELPPANRRLEGMSETTKLCLVMRSVPEEQAKDILRRQSVTSEHHRDRL